jgi:hypothetical protein
LNNLSFNVISGRIAGHAHDFRNDVLDRFSRYRPNDRQGL